MLARCNPHDAPNVLVQTRVGEAEVERFRGSDGHVGEHSLEAEEERGADGDAGCVGGRGEAAEGERGAVDAGSEGGVVACGEGIDGGGEEGDVRGGAVVAGGDLQGSFTELIGCAQRQRVLADQELDNGEVAVVPINAMKGRVTPLIGDGQQASLPRVELGLRDHQLTEYQ